MTSGLYKIISVHKRRKRGYAGDLTPNHLCGDIDMYTPRKI